jgi:caffeoyl-CoA O-methyltransferase
MGVNDPRVWAVVEALERMEETEELEEGLWHIPRETGMLFNIILRHSRAQNILEIGTSSGYSTLFLADAARANGGKVTTCEYSPFKLQLAKQQFEAAGLSDYITVVEGDALTTVEPLDGPFDFVFIDAIKEEYMFYLSMVWPKLRPGGLVVADNMLSHDGVFGIDAYRGILTLMDDASTVTVPIGSGDEFTCKME